MKTINFKQILPILGIGLFSSFLVACDKEEQGPAIAKVQPQPTMSSSSAPVPGASGAALIFNSGYVVVREVVFDGDKQGGGTVSITEEQISTIDLATGAATPAFTLDIPAGTYTSVNMGIEIQDETSKPSVVAEGTYVDASGVSTPVRFEFNSGEVFEANSNTPVTLHENATAVSKINFDPKIWFSTISATQLDEAQRVNGKILINESTNTGLFTIVADRMDDATQAVFQ